MTDNGVFVSELFRGLFSFQRYDITNSLSAKINHKIKNISVNIRVMLLRLGTSNGPQNDAYCGNNFIFGSISCSIDVLIFCLNQTSFTPNELVRRRRTIWAPRAFQVGLSASPYIENGDIWFIIERDWGRK